MDKKRFSGGLTELSVTLKGIPSGFRGAIQISMTVEDNLYEAYLLIQNNFIIAASLRNKAKDKWEYGEKAFDEIENNLKTAEGTFEIYSLTEDEFKQVANANEKSLLELVREISKTIEEIERIGGIGGAKSWEELQDEWKYLEKEWEKFDEKEKPYLEIILREDLKDNPAEQELDAAEEIKGSPCKKPGSIPESSSNDYGSPLKYEGRAEEKITEGQYERESRNGSLPETKSGKKDKAYAEPPEQEDNVSMKDDDLRTEFEESEEDEITDDMILNDYYGELGSDQDILDGINKPQGNEVYQRPPDNVVTDEENFKEPDVENSKTQETDSKENLSDEINRKLELLLAKQRGKTESSEEGVKTQVTEEGIPEETTDEAEEKDGEFEDIEEPDDGDFIDKLRKEVSESLHTPANERRETEPPRDESSKPITTPVVAAQKVKVDIGQESLSAPADRRKNTIVPVDPTQSSSVDFETKKTIGEESEQWMEKATQEIKKLKDSVDVYWGWDKKKKRFVGVDKNVPPEELQKETEPPKKTEKPPETGVEEVKEVVVKETVQAPKGTPQKEFVLKAEPVKKEVPKELESKDIVEIPVLLKKPGVMDMFRFVKTPQVLKLLDKVDGERTLEEVAKEAQVSYEEARKCVKQLVEDGYVSIKTG